MRSQPLPGAIKARAAWLWSSQGGAPVSGMEPWPPATVDPASAPRAHPTSERPAARAQLEFGRASSLAAAARTAAGEDRTHDLRIMRPTRYHLRYCRGYQSLRAALLQKERRSEPQPTFARGHAGSRRLPVEPAGRCACQWHGAVATSDCGADGHTKGTPPRLSDRLREHSSSSGVPPA